jgi:hypothetical protein
LDGNKLSNRELNGGGVVIRRKSIPESHELTEVGLVLHPERLPVPRHCRNLIRNSKSESEEEETRSKPVAGAGSKSVAGDGSNGRGLEKQNQLVPASAMAIADQFSGCNSKQHDGLQSYPVIVQFIENCDEFSEN